MRIWIDGQCFQSTSNVRGIGRYVSELLMAMAEHSNTDMIVSLNGSMGDEAIAARRYLQAILPSVTIEIWFGTTVEPEDHNGYSTRRRADARILARHINEIAPDVAICPSPFEGFDDRTAPFTEPELVNCLTACIFHDLIPHRYPDRYLRQSHQPQAYYRRLMAIGRYDLVLCNSDFTANEYRAIFGKENFVTIGAGLPTEFTRHLARVSAGAAQVPRGSALVPTLPYVLYVGGLDWRKNLPVLIRAMAAVAEVRSGALSLLIVGDHADGELAPVRQQWAMHNLPAEGLMCSGWVSDSQLVDLYRAANMAIQPSLMEGFGLVALEAMATSCPFLAARGGAVAEVIGDETLLFDGHEPAQLATLIRRMLDDQAFRNAAIERGLIRAAMFGWARAAKIARSSLDELCLVNEWTPAQPVEKPSEARTRIVMDVTSTAGSPFLSGIQRVLRLLSEAMLATPPSPRAHDVVLSYSDEPSGWYAVDRAVASAISHDPRDRLGVTDADIHFMIDSSWELPYIHRPRLRDALVLGQQVVHGVHDLGPLTMPGLTAGGMPQAFAKWFEFVLGYSTGIICVSRAVADEVYAMIEAIQLPRAMDIGYLQLGSDFAQVTPESGWLGFLGDVPTFLMVGTIEPRKGHAVVLDAFERLWSQGGQANLLIIGKRGWNTLILQERLACHPQAEKRLFVRANVSDAQLRGAYLHATALIMASYLEGFGLPVVEAGALGCRVILSDLPVFREVGEGAREAWYFPAGDGAALAGVLHDVLAAGPAAELALQPVFWPDWNGTADQVRDMILAGNWYKRYVPAQIDPNAVPSRIGSLTMNKALSLPDRRHALRWVEGPMVSDDGGELQFTVALTNLGSAIWSSRAKPECGHDVNLGGHIMAADGSSLDYDHPRTPIPFVLLPGQEMLIPVRVSTDWFAKGASAIEIELVQERVAWFGDGLTLSLFTPPARAVVAPVPAGANLLGLRLFMLRKPYTVFGTAGFFILLCAVNTSTVGVTVDHDDLTRQLRITSEQSDVDDLPYKIKGGFSHLDPNGYGLLVIHVDLALNPKPNFLRIGLFDHDTGSWTQALPDILIAD